jgi:hypothetical protein
MADKEVGVADLAKYMKRTPQTIRNLLRDNKIKKTGKNYSWSKSAMQAVAKKLGHADKPAKKKVAEAA